MGTEDKPNGNFALLKHTDFTWVLDYVKEMIALTSSEIDELLELLHDNGIRNIDTLENLIDDPEQEVLSNELITALGFALYKRSKLIAAQCEADSVKEVRNPVVYLHGSIFVHRLVLCKNRQNAFVVQTICLDITPELSLRAFRALVASQFGFTEEEMHMFFSRKHETVDPARAYENWANSLTRLDCSQMTTAEWTGQRITVPSTLRDAGLDAGSEVFVLSLVSPDVKGLNLAYGYTEALLLQDSTILASIPLPKELQCLIEPCFAGNEANRTRAD